MRYNVSQKPQSPNDKGLEKINCEHCLPFPFCRWRLDSGTQVKSALSSISFSTPRSCQLLFRSHRRIVVLSSRYNGGPSSSASRKQ